MARLLFSIVLVASALCPRPARAQLLERGPLDVGLAYRAEAIANLTGGVERGTRLRHGLSVGMTLDLEDAVGWKGASLFAGAVGIQGEDAGELVGDIQGISNMTAPNLARLLEAWFEQRLYGDRLSIRFGLYDVNTEFDLIEPAELFLNASHGMGPDFSQTGLNGPSTYPATSLGIRVLAKVSQRLYVRAAAIDGVAGDPHRPGRMDFGISASEGALLVGEIGHLHESGWGGSRGGGRIAVGGYVYTMRFECYPESEFESESRKKSGIGGLYLLAEQVLLGEVGRPGRSLTAFVRAGLADGRVNQVGYYLGAGLVYAGLIADREKDRLGIGVAAAHTSRGFRRARAIAGTSVEAREVAVELSYRAELFPGVVAQPDVQFVINPGLETMLGNALVVALRLEVAF